MKRKHQVRYREAAVRGHLHEQLHERRDVEMAIIGLAHMNHQKVRRRVHTSHKLRRRVEMRVWPGKCSISPTESQLCSRTRCLSTMSVLVRCSCSSDMSIMTLRRHFAQRSTLFTGLSLRLKQEETPCKITLGDKQEETGHNNSTTPSHSSWAGGDTLRHDRRQLVDRIVR